MIPHFTLQKGKQEYLIIRMGDEFHIIDCNEALTKEKRAAVLESGCTPAEMQEMGLSGMTIPKSDIKALTVTGCGFQDDVIFWLNKKKLAFWFPKAYEQKKVDDFFRGIPRKQYKTRTRLKGGKNIDWRLKEQDEVLYQKLRPVGWVYNILCVIICVYPLVLRKGDMKVHGWIVLGMCLIAVLLDIFLPEYFSILLFEDPDKQTKRRKGGQKIPRTRAIQLGYGLICVVGLFAIICTGKYHVVEDSHIVKPALIATLAAFVLLVLICREFQEQLKENFVLVLVYLFLTLAFNFCAFIPHLNHVLGGNLTPCTTPIIDQHYTGGKSTSYYCTVMLPDGRELDLKVTHAEYELLKPGDTIDLQVGTGFFGIDYAIDD